MNNLRIKTSENKFEEKVVTDFFMYSFKGIGKNSNTATKSFNISKSKFRCKA